MKGEIPPNIILGVEVNENGAVAHCHCILNPLKESFERRIILVIAKACIIPRAIMAHDSTEYAINLLNTEVQFNCPHAEVIHLFIGWDSFEQE